MPFDYSENQHTSITKFVFPGCSRDASGNCQVGNASMIFIALISLVISLSVTYVLYKKVLKHFFLINRFLFSLLIIFYLWQFPRLLFRQISLEAYHVFNFYNATFALLIIFTFLTQIVLLIINLVIWILDVLQKKESPRGKRGLIEAIIGIAAVFIIWAATLWFSSLIYPPLPDNLTITSVRKPHAAYFDNLYPSSV